VLIVIRRRYGNRDAYTDPRGPELEEPTLNAGEATLLDEVMEWDDATRQAWLDGRLSLQIVAKVDVPVGEERVEELL
jgi:hypothetical protein